MGAVNHYSINHKTGLGKLALKVANVLNLEYPEERTQSADKKHPVTTLMLYICTSTSCF